MGVGYGILEEEPPVAAKMILSEGSCYEMVEQHGWHYVMPLKKPSLSLMVTGLPWEKNLKKEAKYFSELDLDSKTEILQLFKDKYK